MADDLRIEYNIPLVDKARIPETTGVIGPYLIWPRQTLHVLSGLRPRLTARDVA